MTQPGDLAKAFASAKPGDTIRLAGGRSGDVALRSRAFDPPLRIVADDPADPPAFNSLRTVGVRGVEFEGLNVAFEPTAATYGHQNLVAIEAGSQVVWRGGRISAGMAVSPTVADGERTAFGTVVGWPLGRGIYVAASDARIEGVEITGVERGVVAFRAGAVTVRDSHVHHFRKTAIFGSAEAWDLEANLLETARPWRWGQTPHGDHGNYISIQDGGGGGHVMRRARVAGNVTRRNETGTDVLGLVVSAVQAVEIVGNVVEGTDHQGLLLTDIGGGVVADNVFLGRAQILLRSGVSGVEVRGNVAAGVTDRSGANTIAQHRRLVHVQSLRGGIRLIETAESTT